MRDSSLQILYKGGVRMNINDFCKATESLKPTLVTLYHGSEKFFKILEPTGLDFGNAFVKPGWSLFCWKTYEEAYCWAVMRALHNVLREMKRRGAPINSCTDFCIRDPKTNKILINGGRFDELTEYMKQVSSYGYVYTFKAHINHVSIGNDSSHQEYTVRENHIKPTKIEKISLSKANIDKYCDIIDESKYNDYTSNIKNNWDCMGRGLVSLLLTNDWSYNMFYNNATIKKIRKDMRDGILNPGDDLEKYMYEKNISIAYLSPSQRVKMKVVGLYKGR